MITSTHATRAQPGYQLCFRSIADAQRAGYYYARFDGAGVPLNHTIVVGAQSYYRISFNHRYLYVRTTDVTLG